MGSVQSSLTQEEGQNTNIQLVTNNVKSLELDEVSFSKPVYPPLKQMLNWSLQEIRVVYEKFQRRSATNSPFVDKVFFCKLVPFTRSNAVYIFDSFSRKKEFISIYEFLCILTICSYTHFINKIHFFYILFDLDCGGDISLNELLIVFKSTITGYCKLTDSPLPNPHKLEKFAKLMFLKSDIQADNALELKEIIEWCEGNARAMELFARFEPKYKIKEKFEVFKNFKPYPEQIGLNMLKQINKANHDETYLDELSVIMKKDKANSYMKNTSSFNTYQQELRMERSMTTDQIKKSYYDKNNNKISNSDQKNNVFKSQTSIDQPKFLHKIQQTQNKQNENVDDDNDDVKNLDIALFSHQTIFKVKQNEKEETQTKFPKLGKTSNSLHQSSTTLQKTRISTHEGQISRQEILKLMDYFEFQKFRQKVLDSRQENQRKREEQNQKLESDSKLRIQKEIEDEEYQKKINPKKQRSFTQDAKNQSKQIQEFQKKEIQKNDKIRAEKEIIEDQNLQLDSDQKLQDFLQVCVYKKDLKELERIKIYLLQYNIDKLQENNYQEIILNIYQFLQQMDKTQKEDILKTILHWFIPQQQRQPKNIIITKGTAITRQEIFKLKEYFDFLSDKEKTIKINKFSKAMQDKRHMKRVSQSLFQYLDPLQTTEITFDQLLLGIYPSLQQKDIQTINSWVRIYQKTFDMQSKDLKVVQNEQETKPIIKKKKILPASTLIRIKEIYNNLDEERKGYVTIDNIKHKFTYGFTQKDIEKLFDIYDANKDGVLEVPDFAKMILPPDYTIEGIE